MRPTEPKPSLDLWTALASGLFLLAVGSALFGVTGTPGAATEAARVMFFFFVALLVLSGQFSALRKPAGGGQMNYDDASPVLVRGRRRRRSV